MFSFREYLYSVYCNENLSFWIEAELFRNSDPQTLKERAKELWNKYFDISSDYSMAIDDSIDLEKLSKQLDNPTIDAFKSVQEHIWWLLNKMWISFLTSKYFQDYSEMKSKSPKAAVIIRSRTTDNLILLQQILSEKEKQDEKLSVSQ